MISAVPDKLPMPNCQNIDKIDARKKLYIPYFKREVTKANLPTTNQNIYNTCVESIGDITCKGKVYNFCKDVSGFSGYLLTPTYIFIKNGNIVEIVPIDNTKPIFVANDNRLNLIFQTNRVNVSQGNYKDEVTVTGSSPNLPISVPLNKVQTIPNTNVSYVITTDTFPDPQSPCPSPDHCDNSGSEVPWWIWLIILVFVAVAVILAFTLDAILVPKEHLLLLVVSIITILSRIILFFC